MTDARPSIRPPIAIAGSPALRPRQLAISLGTVVVPLAGTVAAVIVAWRHGVSWWGLGLFLAFYVATTLGIEFGFHRLLSHRALETSSWIRTLFAAFGSMAGQGRVLHWVADHRRHHAHSDTPDDPHSPHVMRAGEGPRRLDLLRGWWHAHIGHMLTPELTNCTLFARDLTRDTTVMRINRLYLPLVALGLILPGAIAGIATQSWYGALTGVLWGGFVRMFVVQQVTWSVASFAHMFGAQPYDAGDLSRNNFPVALLSFGSAWQNNHHAFPKSAYLGLKRWEIDITGWFINGLRAVGLARNVRIPSDEELAAKRRAVDPRAIASPPESSEVNPA